MHHEMLMQEVKQPHVLGDSHFCRSHICVEAIDITEKGSSADKSGQAA